MKQPIVFLFLGLVILGCFLAIIYFVWTTLSLRFHLVRDWLDSVLKLVPDTNCDKLFWASTQLIFTYEGSMVCLFHVNRIIHSKDLIDWLKLSGRNVPTVLSLRPALLGPIQGSLFLVCWITWSFNCCTYFRQNAFREWQKKNQDIRLVAISTVSTVSGTRTEENV